MGKTALIFCSASYTIDPKYNEEARKVVGLLHGKGYGIVSGGAIKGTMGAVADAAYALGAENTGVIPRFMAEYAHPRLTRLEWTDTMSQRKDKMRELGRDVAVALPGGIGTLDELFETLTLSKLGKYDGKVIAYNFEGFYDSLAALLDFYVSSHMLEQKDRDRISFPKTLEELERLI